MSCRQTDFPVTDETRRPFGCGGIRPPFPPMPPYIPVPGPVGPQGPAGPQGETGPAGAYVTALTLTTEEGAVTGGTATLSDGTTITITVTPDD